MALPGVSMNVLDPGLGQTPANAGKTQVKAGVCNKGTPNTLYSAGNQKAGKDQIGSGPLFDCAAQALGVAGGSVLMLPILPSVYGVVTGGFSLSGSGTGTVTGSKGPEQIIKVKIVTGGTLGTAAFQVAIGTGAYGATVTTVNSPPWSYQVPGQYFSTLVFAAGTYVLNDVYTLNLDGTITRTGTGTATLLDASNHSPVDAKRLKVKIVTAGALGTAAFQLSLDDGASYGGTVGTVGSGIYVVPGWGIVLTFAGTFTAGDVYSGSSTAASFSNSDVTNALTALLANPSTWGWVHIVGTPSNAANAASLASVVDSKMTEALNAFRYVFAVVECPTTESDSDVKAAFVSFVGTRVGVVAGDIKLTSVATGHADRRNLAWAYTALLAAKKKLSTHPGMVSNRASAGPLKNVLDIYRDEAATPALDEARFVTARTINGRAGFFITRGRMMASNGSDFSQVQRRQVMDRACTIARDGYLDYMNDDVRVADDTGFIDERDAQEIDSVVTAKLRAELLAAEEVSSVAARVSRTDNLLSTSTLTGEDTLVPLAYLENISIDIGYKNPALAAAA